MALTTAPAIDYALPRQQDEGDHWIDDWRPEDPVFWETIGRPIARRNLIFSIFAEHVGFSVWMLWSIVVVQMTAAAGWPRMRPSSRFGSPRGPSSRSTRRRRVPTPMRKSKRAPSTRWRVPWYTRRTWGRK